MAWWTTPGSQSIQEGCSVMLDWSGAHLDSLGIRFLSRISIIVIPGEGENRIEEFQSCSSIPPSTDHFDFVVGPLWVF